MFDFLKRKKVKLPENYMDLVDEKNYVIFLDKCLAILKNLKVNVVSSDDGDIKYLNSDKEEAHYFLDNLLRKYLQLEEIEKDKEIIRHFSKLQDKSDAYKYLFKDFEYAKQFLKILVRPAEMLPNYEEFIYRSDFPNLLTFLVLDFEEQFKYIRNDSVIEWQVTDKELFEIAIENLSNENVEVKEYQFGDKFTVYILFNGDFSASYTLLLEEKLEFSIGAFGSLIAIPTKGTALIHPIETNEVLDLIEILNPLVQQFYNEDPGSITLDFYWFYKREYYMFDKTLDGERAITIKLPKKLIELFAEK
jgi:hypothetical protein